MDHTPKERKSFLIDTNEYKDQDQTLLMITALRNGRRPDAYQVIIHRTGRESEDRGEAWLTCYTHEEPARRTADSAEFDCDNTTFTRVFLPMLCRDDHRLTITF